VSDSGTSQTGSTHSDSSHAGTSNSVTQAQHSSGGALPVPLPGLF
jgi:hypothetical protein